VVTNPIHFAETLAAFVDTLIPGDDLFPPASVTGAQALLTERIRMRYGREGFSRVLAVLDGDGFFREASPDKRVETVRGLEREDSELFRFLRFATYFAYYQQPAVIAAIRELGHDYNETPQPLGYELPPFDPARHLPATPRGSYKATGDIVRIDLSGLADLDLPMKNT
jgi:hypothetical protein